MSKFKPTLCLDFDGVVHSYTTPWRGPTEIPDPPVDGAIAFILSALRDFDVCIFSTRSSDLSGVHAMKTWLKMHSGQAWYESPDGPGLESVKFPLQKPPALVSIDDRAITFTGVWPAIADLLNFKPWNKK